MTVEPVVIGRSFRTVRSWLPGRRRLAAAGSEISAQILAISCRSAQIVVRWHAVRNAGINGPELGVEVCSQLLGAPPGLCCGSV
jgi:hypothetical protein